MRELFIAIIGLLVLLAFGRRAVVRKERAKAVAIGLGLLTIGVYQGTIYDLSVMELLLLRYRLPRFNSILIDDVPLVLGYAVLLGAMLSMVLPARSRGT
jgi:hypothetical protein